MCYPHVNITPHLQTREIPLVQNDTIASFSQTQKEIHPACWDNTFHNGLKKLQTVSAHTTYEKVLEDLLGKSFSILACCWRKKEKGEVYSVCLQVLCLSQRALKTCKLFKVCVGCACRLKIQGNCFKQIKEPLSHTVLNSCLSAALWCVVCRRGNGLGLIRINPGWLPRFS